MDFFSLNSVIPMIAVLGLLAIYGKRLLTLIWIKLTPLVFKTSRLLLSIDWWFWKGAEFKLKSPESKSSNSKNELLYLYLTFDTARRAKVLRKRESCIDWIFSRVSRVKNCDQLQTFNCALWDVRYTLLNFSAKPNMHNNTKAIIMRIFTLVSKMLILIQFCCHSYWQGMRYF